MSIETPLPDPFDPDQDRDAFGPVTAPRSTGAQDDTLCPFPGCDQPREKRKNGQLNRYCLDHKGGKDQATGQTAKEAAAGQPSASGPGAPFAPPKASGTGSGDAKKAAMVLEGFYRLMGIGLWGGKFHEAAGVIADNLDTLRLENESALAQAPKVAKMIANTGEISGIATFVAVNAMVLYPVADSVSQELKRRRASRDPAEGVIL